MRNRNDKCPTGDVRHLPGVVLGGYDEKRSAPEEGERLNRLADWWREVYRHAPTVTAQDHVILRIAEEHPDDVVQILLRMAIGEGEKLSWLSLIDGSRPLRIVSHDTWHYAKKAS